MTSHDLVTQLANSWPPEQWRDVVCLIAVSGGPDSVALLHAMHELSIGTGCEPHEARIQVGHFNHGLRGDASQADEDLVGRICKTLSLPLHVGRGDTQAAARRQGDGIEAAARQQRYDFLLRQAEQIGARFVVTAHTADDQVETVLHRILRGTGIGGLAGMPRSRPLSPAVSLIRPLLNLRRADVEAYVKAADLPFRVDDSNHDEQYTRNRLRHSLLPRLRAEYNVNVDEALLRLARQAGDCRDVVQQFVDQLASQATATDAQVSIDVDPLSKQSPYLVCEVLIRLFAEQGWSRQGMTQQHWRQLAEMIQVNRSETPTEMTLPGGLWASRQENSLVIRRRGE